MHFLEGDHYMAFENAVRLQEINEEMERLQNEAKSVRAQLVDEILVAMKEYGITDEILVAMKEYGITLADLGQHQSKRRGDVKPAKYANPHGEGTWSGSGRRPKWFKQALDNGVSEEEMLIKTTTF